MTKSYALIAKSSPDLGKHLNHKISVTGTVAPTRSSTAAGSTPAPRSTSPGGGYGAPSSATASAQPTETVTVQSFKMVSATCP
jgi:hypothetical protein